MSAKIENSGFKRAIDDFIHDGKSSRYISSWLAKRGRNISHVTIANYRNMGGDAKPVSGPDGNEQTDPNKLAMLVLSKAIQNQDNPVKLRAYVDSYSKLIGRNGTGFGSPVTMEEEMEELDTPARLAKVKGIILNMLKFYHPYMKDPMPMEGRMEISRDYRDWHASVVKVMEPIFNGTLPNSDLLSVNEMDSLS